MHGFYSRAELDSVVTRVLGERLEGSQKQDIYTPSTTQRYQIGCRKELPDGRVFRYCHAKNTADGDLLANVGCFVDKLAYYESNETIAVHDAGARVINFDNKAGEPIALEELVGGWFGGATPRLCNRIMSNLAGSGAGGVAPVLTAITLERGIPVGITLNRRVYAYPNKYKDVVNTGGIDSASPLGAVIAVPLIDITHNYYFWGQTWGDFQGLAGIMARDVGMTVGKRVFYFCGLGYMRTRPEVDVDDIQFQRGGTVLMDGNGATGGDQLCQLELTP